MGKSVRETDSIVNICPRHAKFSHLVPTLHIIIRLCLLFIIIHYLFPHLYVHACLTRAKYHFKDFGEMYHV